MHLPALNRFQPGSLCQRSSVEGQTPPVVVSLYAPIRVSDRKVCRTSSRASASSDHIFSSQRSQKLGTPGFLRLPVYVYDNDVTDLCTCKTWDPRELARGRRYSIVPRFTSASSSICLSAHPVHSPRQYDSHNVCMRSTTLLCPHFLCP